MKAQFDKLFGSGKEYDEIDTNGTTSDTPQPTKNLLQKIKRRSIRLIWF